MKKLLSVLLTLCMMIGVGLCGTISASAARRLGELIVSYTVMQRKPQIVPLVVYDYSCGMDSLQPAFEAGLLSNKNLADVRTGVNTAVALISSDVTNYLVFRTVQDIEQAVALCDEIFAESFTGDFLAEFNALKEAYGQAIDQYYRAYDVITDMWADGAITDRNLLAETRNVILLLAEMYDISLQKGSIAEMTAFYVGKTAQISATMAKLDGTDPGGSNVEKWWENFSPFMQWILRWFFLGWIWMN